MKKILICILAVLLAAGAGAYAYIEFAAADSVSAQAYRPELKVKGTKLMQDTAVVEEMMQEAIAAQIDPMDTEPIDVTRRKPGEKVAYLTFDDGPGEYTLDLLDILDEHDVKATFFVVGNRLDEQGAEILREISERGHVIGIHCYNHDYNKVYASKEAFIKDFDKVFLEIQEITGEKPNVYRFPGGSSIGKAKGFIRDIIEILDERGFSFYDWNVSTGDGGSSSTTESVIESAKKLYNNVEDPVVLMHDTKKSTVKAVPTLIRMMQKDGFEFDTVDHREPIGFVSGLKKDKESADNNTSAEDKKSID